QRLSRYDVPLLPTGYLLAGVGLVQLHRALRRVRRGRWTAVSWLPLALVILVTLSGPSRLFKIPGPTRPQVTWPTRLYEAGFSPGDLILTNNPTVTYVYLGQTNFWLRSRVYQKYVREDGLLLRDLHTNAV